MSEELYTPCGRVESGSGKPFTPETLEQHKQDCPMCNPYKSLKAQYELATGEPWEEHPYIDGSDIPDGAYFALMLEQQGWFP